MRVSLNESKDEQQLGEEAEQSVQPLVRMCRDSGLICGLRSMIGAGSLKNDNRQGRRSGRYAGATLQRSAGSTSSLTASRRFENIMPVEDRVASPVPTFLSPTHPLARARAGRPVVTHGTVCSWPWRHEHPACSLHRSTAMQRKRARMKVPSATGRRRTNNIANLAASSRRICRFSF